MILMAKPHSVCFLFFLLFFTCCLARHVPTQSQQQSQSQFKECQLDSIDALEPDNSIESEAGLTETWNAANHPELRCAGVAILRRTINPSGLHLPSYTTYPELHFVDQGKGVIGMVIPGCAETYEEPQVQRPQQQHERDRHQKVRYLRHGDVIAVPPGVPYWTYIFTICHYNYGKNPLVIITLQDTTNNLNQLDPTPTRFYIAGKPEKEHSESESESESESGKRKEKKKEGAVNNMFGGFDPAFLSRVLKVKEDLISKLQSPKDDRKKQIIHVKGGLSIIRPPLEQEIRETEQREEEDEPREGEHREWRRERTRRKEREGEEGEEEVVEEKETETKTKTKTREKHERRGEGEEGEEEEERTRTRTRERRERHEGQKGQSNALEETVCTMKLHENLADPSRADIFNPRAGRVSTVNSLTLPVLKKLNLGAEWVNLYKNGVYVPHWNINANSVMYVTRGKGRVQVVNCEGESVFDGEVKRGQVVVVPQGFGVAKQAGSEGLEYIAFKTNDMAMISPLVGMNSAISGTPAEVLGHAFGLSPEEVRELKNNRKESILASPHDSREDAYISMV